MFRRGRSSPRVPQIAHTDVHASLWRYLEWAQDAIVASLAVVALVVMVRSLLKLAQLALVEGREPRIVLPQILLLLILVELFRTMLVYLREHRVAVGLMIEVAIVGVLRELLINPPGSALFNAAGVSPLLLVLGVLLIADRLTYRDELDQADGFDESKIPSAVPRHS